MLNNLKPLTCSFRSVPLVSCFLSLFIVYYANGESSGTNDATNPVPSESRDPFWPVGYVPKDTTAKPKKVASEKALPSGKYEWAAAKKQLSNSGVSKKGQNEFFAVINGKVKSVGDTVSVDYKGITYTWAIESIKPPGSVKLRRVSAL